MWSSLEQLLNQSSVYAVMGLPLDDLSQAQAISKLWHVVRHREKSVLTTPNLNFVIACRKDPDFFRSVLESDINVADGMPLVWIAKALNIPITERVAGSSLFEAIRTSPPPDSGPPMRVFFFGGAPGVAQLAHERINADVRGMVSVGFLDPGFVDVDEMSGPFTIDAINACSPDFVVVALGAVKGQAWINRNRASLTASLVSHLGAVINFSAGSVRRSPQVMQRLGLEWLWRIKEEPQLWRRYLSDGLTFLGIVCREVLPLWWSNSFRPVPVDSFRRARIVLGSGHPATRLSLVGAWGRANQEVLSDALATVVHTPGHLIIDLEKTNFLDASAVGALLSFTGKRSAAGLHCECEAASAALGRILRLHGAARLCHL